MTRIGVLLGVLLALGGCASATGEQEHVAGSTEALRRADAALLATGDSNIFGFGATDHYGSAQQLADDLAAAEDRVSTSNISVPGASTADYLANQLDVAVEYIEDNRKAGDDLSVLVGIGGNDLRNFLYSAEFVQLDCANQAPQCMGRLAQILMTARANLDVIFGTLRAELGDDAKLVAQTQANVFFAPHCLPMGVETIAHVTLEGHPYFPAPGLNQSIREIAAAHGAEVVDISPAFTSHEIATSQAAAVDPAAAADTWVSSDCTHPNDGGHAAIREMYRGVIGK